jgi:hypothetical protein
MTWRRIISEGVGELHIIHVLARRPPLLFTQWILSPGWGQNADPGEPALQARLQHVRDDAPNAPLNASAYDRCHDSDIIRLASRMEVRTFQLFARRGATHT